MDNLLAFWGSVLWFCLEVWITDPASKAARAAEIVTGIVYLIGSSFVIALSEAPLVALIGSVFALFGIYHVSGASGEALSPYD